MEKQKCCILFNLLVLCWLIPVNSKYLITTPRVYYTGSTEDVNVNLYNIQGPWNITASLKITRGGKEISNGTKLFEGTSRGTLKLKVPGDVSEVRYGQFNNVHLVVEGYGVTNNSQDRFKEKEPLTLKKQDITLFIQTDKPIYKPGQTIRMRVICLSHDLKPLGGKVQRVSIANPSGVRMMQWDKLDMQNGIARLEMPLSKYPVVGKWKIEAQYEGKKAVKDIEIAKYVLPKFEVIIRPPSFIAIDSREVSGTICARYTYGQLVTGRIKAVFSLKQNWWWSSRLHEKEIVSEKNITGCYDFTLTNNVLGLSKMKYSYYGTVLNITAVMTEEATGISQTASSTKTDIVPYRVRMNFRIGTPKHFKPGLPFYGQLHVTSPDGQPIKNEKVTITADDHTRGSLYKKEFLVTNGIVDFVIHDVPIGAKYLSIDARHGSGKIFEEDYGISQWYSTAGIHCRPWYSKSWSFLALQKLSSPLKVGGKAEIRFQYTLKEDTFRNDFVYHLMCRGKMTASGRKQIAFLTEATHTEATKPTTIPKKLNTTTRDNLIGTPTVNISGATTLSPVTVSNTRSSAQKLRRASGTIEFPVTQDMVPSCRLLVYYVRKDGETVADSMVVDIEDKLENQVSVQFSESVGRPGMPVQITLSAAPGSTVALAAVDKSVRLLREADDLDSEEVFDILSAQDVGPSSRYRRKKECKSRNPFWRPFMRRGRSIMPSSRDVYVDASKAFYDTGLIYFSDLMIETRPCPEYSFQWRSRENGPGPFPQPLFSIANFNMGGGFGGGVDSSGLPGPNAENNGGRRRKTKKVPASSPPTVRKNFPETWLWREESISNATGQIVITANVPDTITSWHASAIAMSTTSGIGVTEPSILTVFQPFFVSFTLPYSVVRGEQVSIITTVFNYLSQCSTILVSLMKTAEYFELFSDGDQKICVCGNQAKSVKYVITPLRLGHIPLKVTVKNVIPSICQDPSNEAPLGVSDAVLRKLLVEPEGVRQEYTYNSFVCPRDQNGIASDKIDISLPKNIVPGSLHATISVIGDLMGPSLTGLDGLIRLPTGCGEQNMVKFAPNIFIMQYLSSTKQLGGDLENKAVGFLRTGYQRELTYKRKDGSYSAFGNRDKEGSLWLTAFVLRSFSQARQFIFVDNEEINSTTKWIESKQLDNGCFQKQGKLFNKALKGGVSTPLTLTAYVVISLLESKVRPSNQVIVNALKCITVQKDSVTDSYSNAIIAFALTLARHPSRGEFLARLRSKAIYKDGTKHWAVPVKSAVKQGESFWVPPYYRAPSTNIEMTSYALLAFIGDGSDRSAVADALPIVRWITKQRNALGGFASTQDTCIALQALSRYAGYVFGESTMIRVDVGYTNDPKFYHSFRINNNNRLVLQRAEIPVEILPMKIPVDAFGDGCVLIQADVAYNVRDAVEQPAFDISVTVRRRPSETSALVMTEVGEKLCQPLEIYICAKWLDKDVSGMAVIETKLVSGFTVDEQTLERLMNLVDFGVMKYEIEGNNVILYFDEIKNLCVSFGILQTSIVKKTKPSSVRVYEYYDTDKSGTQMYNITEDLCLSEPEKIPNQIPTVLQTNCPSCPENIDISKQQALACKANNILAVRIFKDGAMRFEFISKAKEFIAKKTEKKYSHPIEITLPKICRCSALNPHSKALVLLQENKLQKKLRRVVLSKNDMVLHRKKGSTIQLEKALSSCP